MGDTVRFVARDVCLDPQVGYIGFADEGAQRYFWMQPGERTSGKEEIWLERDDQKWGGTGREWTVILTRDKFFLNTRDLRWMACDAVEIDFAIDDATYTQLSKLLQQVMVDCLFDLEIRGS
jgi:hypothetical protein